MKWRVRGALLALRISHVVLNHLSLLSEGVGMNNGILIIIFKII